MSVTRSVRNLQGRMERLSLPAPHWTGSQKVGTGVRLEALFSGPRTGRKFARTYSAWTWGDSLPEGEKVIELTEEDYLLLCEKAGCDPIGVKAEEA